MTETQKINTKRQREGQLMSKRENVSTVKLETKDLKATYGKVQALKGVNLKFPQNT